MNPTPYTPGAEGVFRIPAPRYHAAPGVSKHSLDLLAECPLKLALYRQHGMDATDAMEDSTLCHTAVLEPHLLRDQFFIRPDTYEAKDRKGNFTVKPWRSNATVCAEWLEAHEGKPVLSRTELNHIENVAKCCREHSSIGPMLEDGEAELSLFARCPLTGLLRKGRPDWITKDNSGRIWILDFKFVASAKEHDFARQVIDLRYYVQHAYYVDLCELLGFGTPGFLFIAAEKQPMHPKSAVHRVEPFELPRAAVQLGRNTYIRDLHRYAECEASGQWPGDMDTIKTLKLPKWFFHERAA